jgi:hypothetical protein
MKEINISDLLGIWFHDVKVRHISIDYFKREVVLEFILPVGFWNSPNRFGLTDGEIEGTLVFTGLLYWVMQPPDEDYSYADTEGIEITTAGSVKKEDFKSPLPDMPQDLPEDAFLHYFYISEWNSFIFVAATDVRFQQVKP